MGRYNKEKNKIEEAVIPEEVVIPKEVIKEETMRLNGFLSNFSQHSRNLDKVIIKWYMKRESINSIKTKEEWEKLIQSFFSETER